MGILAVCLRLGLHAPKGAAAPLALLVLACCQFLCAPAQAGEALAPAGHPEREANGLWACRASLSSSPLRVFYTDQHGRRFRHMAALVDWLHHDDEQLDCATNGGIYDVDLRPLGWLIADGILLRPLNTEKDHAGNFFLQPNGALVISQGHARIGATETFVDQARVGGSDIDLALQSGPLLLASGVISSRLDPASTSRYMRDAVCLADPDSVIIAYSDRLVSLYEFAAALKEIGCKDALYLDGHVAQMYPIDQALEPAQQRELSAFIGFTSRIHKNE